MKKHYSNNKRHADTLLANYLVKPVIFMYLLNLETLKVDRTNVRIRVSDQKGRIFWEGKIIDWEYAIPSFTTGVWMGDYPLKSVVISFQLFYPMRDAYGVVKVNCKVEKQCVTCSVGDKSEIKLQMPRDHVMPYGIQRKLKAEMFREHLEEDWEVHRRGTFGNMKAER